MMAVRPSKKPGRKERGRGKEKARGGQEKKEGR